MLALFGAPVLVWRMVYALQPGQPPPVSAPQAIHLAEVFIQENGYTATPAVTAQGRYELLDLVAEHGVDSILLGRRNTLHPHAFCLREDADRWYIGFLATRVNLATLSAQQRQTDLPGRVVFVDKRSQEAGMMHKDPLFSHFQKVATRARAATR
jgi:hypothetical protein